jgi:quercetin dioxygenase-like cupin family protein
MIRPEEYWRGAARVWVAATIGAGLVYRVGNRRRISVIDEEEYGGDPPCWAHLFDEETISMEDEQQGGAESSATALLTTGQGQMVNLAALAHSATAPGAIWTRQSEDLNLNLLVFTSGEGVAEHVNAEVDVLLVGIAGTGAVTIDGTRQILSPGHVMVIPKGTNRSIQSTSDPFAYLTCHRRRGGLWPGRKP